MLRRCKTCKYYNQPIDNIRTHYNNNIYDSEPTGHCANKDSMYYYVSEWKASACKHYDFKNGYYRFMHKVRALHAKIFNRPISHIYIPTVTDNLMKDINDTPLYYQFIVELSIVLGFI